MVSNLATKFLLVVSTSIGVAIGYSVFKTYVKEDYDKHWNFTDFKGKVILDIGADYGSTAYYFLQKGVLRVIAVEGDDYLAEQLKQNFKDNPKVVPIHLMIRSGRQIEELIEKYRPDIVKVDIEGDEKHILDVDVRKAKEWLIETHTNDIHKYLVEWFVKNGFDVNSYPYVFIFKTFQRANVIHARIKHIIQLLGLNQYGSYLIQFYR